MNIRHSNILGWHSSPEARPPRRRASRGVGRAASGFTLIELMVVLAITAIVTALTVGTFKSLGDNNQRTGCQANLQQVYQGLRLYMADEGGQVPLYDPNAKAPEKKNIGLWNLWTFPDTSDPDKIAAVGTSPIRRYLRSVNVLHCPSDSETGEVRVNPEEIYSDADKKFYNPDFLSYQMYATNDIDKPYSSMDTKPVPTDTQFQTYLPVRVPTLSATASDSDKLKFKRQLRQIDQSSTKTPPDPYNRPPLDNTIVTWCRHHRYMRDFDNVLFFDGSVQLIPREQDVYKPDSCDIDTAAGVLTGSNRVPRRADCD